MKKIIAIVLFLYLVSVHAPALACTVFASTDGESVMAGNNEDWLERDTFMWFLPAQDGKFGRVFYGFENAHPQGGMNEKGLFFDWFAMGGNAAPEDPKKLNYPGDLSDGLLEQCSTVEEAIALYGKYNDANLGYAVILLADSTGDIAIITWDWAADKPYIEHQKGGHLEVGVGAQAIKGTLGQKDSVNMAAYSKMLSVASNENTLYSTASNLKTLDITLYNQHHFDKSVVFNLKVELAKGPHIISIPSLFPDQAPGGMDKLTPWNLRTTEQNIAFIVFGAMFAASIIIFVFLLARGRCKGLKAVLPAIGIASGAAMMGTIVLLHLHMYFILKYGIGILGAAAVCLPWAAVVLAAAALVLSVLSWIKKQHPLAVRIFASVMAVITPALLWYLSTIGVFFQ